VDVELAIVAGRIDVLLDRARTASSIAARRFALDALARGLLAADPGAVSAAQRDEARALRVDPSTVSAAGVERSPHATLVPLVADGVGFLRQFYVLFDPVGSETDAQDESARRAILDAITAAAERAPPPSEPALHRFVPAQPHALRRARIEGRSLSAAAFVSAVSLWTDRPVRADVAISGELREGQVLSVGEIAAKVRAAIDHGARAIVVPASDLARAQAISGAIEIIAAAKADDLLSVLEAKVPRVSPDRAVQDARSFASTGWNGYRWPSIRERLARLSGVLPAERVELRVEVLARWAAAVRHVGDPEKSLELLREAETIVRSGEVPDAPITLLYQQLAMTCRQLFRFGEAARAAKKAARVARSARLRGELLKALGCVGLVEMSRGDAAAAIVAYEEALAVDARHRPQHMARTRAYLIEAYGAAGLAAEARAHFDAAMEEVERGDDDGREAWVRTSWGGALVALDQEREAVEVLDDPSVRASVADDPLPGLIARRHLGVALARTEGERGFELLASSPIAHGRALEPHLAFLAHLNVLFEARERSARGAWSPDVAARAAKALDHVPRYGAADKHLGRPLAALRRRIDDRAALDVLLSRCAHAG
jgi:tetratricopeptide (TPR) repeat protein